MPKLEGKKMFLFMAPKKAGVAKKSQQKIDRERREAEAKEAKNVTEEISQEHNSNSALAANAKGAEALANLKFEE